ncbi:MAG: hypothetical protein AB7I35_01460 [Ramlibacter sp.]
MNRRTQKQAERRAAEARVSRTVLKRAAWWLVPLLVVLLTLAWVRLA